MIWTSEWENDSVNHGVDVGELDEGIRGMYMNIGRSMDATHKFLERCARSDVAVAFVGEFWVEKKSGLGTQSHPDFMMLGSMCG